MTPGPDLRELDRRIVPVAAVRLRRWLDAAARRRAAAVARIRSAIGSASAAGQRVDDRATASGPLRVLRDVPQLALLVVSVVFIAGAVAAVRLDDGGTAPGPGGPSRVQLGVPAGTSVEAYLAEAEESLDDLADDRPDAQVLAVVHFERYVGADEVDLLLDGTDAHRVYLRASDAGKDAEVIALPVLGGKPGALMPALCEATATRKSDQANSLTTLADAIAASTPEDQASKANFQEQAALATAEAQAYSGACTTAFSAVVESSAELLQEVSERPGVRGVEHAAAGAALTDLEVQPLLPESIGVLPAEQS